MIHKTLAYFTGHLAGKTALLQYRLAKAGHRRMAWVLGWRARRKVEH